MYIFQNAVQLQRFCLEKWYGKYLGKSADFVQLNIISLVICLFCLQYIMDGKLVLEN